MNEVVQKVWKIIEETKMPVSTASRHMRISGSSLHYWVKGQRKPGKKSIEKNAEIY